MILFQERWSCNSNNFKKNYDSRKSQICMLVNYVIVSPTSFKGEMIYCAPFFTIEPMPEIQKYSSIKHQSMDFKSKSFLLWCNKRWCVVLKIYTKIIISTTAVTYTNNKQFSNCEWHTISSEVHRKFFDTIHYQTKGKFQTVVLLSSRKSNQIAEIISICLFSLNRYLSGVVYIVCVCWFRIQKRALCALSLNLSISSMHEA